MAKSPEEMLASMIANLKEKTGRTLEEWVATARKSGYAKHGEIVKHLKSEHGIGHGYANLIAQQTLQAQTPAEDDLVAAQYSGPKAGLRPIYEAIVGAASGLGGDVEVSPKKTYVSLRRTKQFALVQPSTATRVDLGVNLKGAAVTPRLEASGSFNAMVSHRVRLSDASQVDAEVVGWLRQAYESA